MDYYKQTSEDVISELNSSSDGLNSEEVSKRRETYGLNEIAQKDQRSIFSLFVESFKDPMVIVLLIVAIIQILIGEQLEPLIIFTVLILNSILSVVQTKKAEDSLESLRKMASPNATVLRDGKTQSIDAKDITVGDIIILEAGDNIPADGRLIEAESLQVQEGSLTGESVSSDKKTTPLTEDTPLADRINMVYSGTLVTYGRGRLLVTEIGETTEMGKVAQLIQSASHKQTPLQRKLDHFSKKLGWAILLLSVLIFAIQAGRIFLGNTEDVTVPLLNAFMFAVAVAVAAIPEALQSIVTIVLSVGTNKMAKQHAIIRQLPAVETLGSTSVICTDKTGTLTQNKMTVVDSYIPNGASNLFSGDPQKWTESEQILMQIATLTNDSTLNDEGDSSGDPTEVALIAYSNKQSLPYDQVRKTYPRLSELPFDSSRKRMSTVHEIDGEKRLLVKGGPDVIFSLCSKIKMNGDIVYLTDELQKELVDQNERFSDQAMRVLAFAYKPVETDDVSIEDENDLIFVGLLAMIDPPRQEVYHAVEDATRAGIKTVMITGDHKTTARAIARDLNISSEGDLAFTGQELDALSEEELMENLEKITVYARVTPENKIRIVKAWQNKKQITAMTGDGVNDAPALKQADIGIAMGSGTDVSKDASAMILTDDNFVSIVKAVSVGRTIYSNIKKATAYLFSGNLGAVIAILFALIMNWVSPFTALQLLFINLVNDSLPAIALGLEPEEPNVMSQKPRDPDETIFSGQTLQTVIFRGSLIGIAVIISQFIGLQYYTAEISIAMAFTTLILARTLQVFPARSITQTSFEAGFLKNKFVILAFVFCLGLYGVTLLPGIRGVFSIPATFGLVQWAIAAGLALSTTIIMELRKKLLPFK
ncbi:calcium-translocating P-type ATPase, PMCA-type [Alkalibacterium olivapovliticus]|uniref:P-type Ca(2+) transporter n=1 Tax=Alkalibacterium olivapovliticus TaxID=99907 RepID=A0A2T0W9R0_9LACT|nr:calcium-translocating P-type ATPase, PMCA-type [Alkalibacterium olivapovliticus]PRY83450.1 calcium-translocating P-type ATPase [Alkalibacterium olivapovliticus]